MAAQHVRELRRMQPHGPYRLGGYCVGGMIAFEMARQLTDGGERVERLILIDASAANAIFRGSQPIIDALAGRGPGSGALDRRAVFLWRLHYYERRFRIVWRAGALDQLKWVASNLRRRLPFSRKPLPETRAAGPAVWPAPVTETANLRGAEVVRFQERAAAGYIPGKYPGEIDLIFSIDGDKGQVSPEVAAHESEGPAARRSRKRWGDWERVAAKVRAYGIMGPHLSLATANISALADQIRTILARASRSE